MHLLSTLLKCGVVETYLYENVTETSCLGAIFTCSIYDVPVTCYFGGVLTSLNQNIKIMSNSTTAELHGDVIGRCKVLSLNDVAVTLNCDQSC